MLLTEPAWLGLCEAFRATAAHDLITERNFQLFDYTFRHNEGGSLFVALIAALFYKIFGASIFSTQLVPLSFSLASFIIGYYLLKKYANVLSANIFAIIFIFAPQTYIRLSLLIYGNHVDSILFTFIMLYCLGRILLAKSYNIKQETVYFSLLGLVCGFSIWFAYINTIGLLSCLVCLFIFDRSLFKRQSFRFFLVSFVLGISPLIIYNLNYAHGGIIYVLHKPVYLHLFNKSIPEFISKTYSFFVFDLPLSQFFSKGWLFSRSILAYSSYLIYVSVFTMFIFVSMKSNRGRKLDCSDKKQFFNLFIFVYLTIFLATYLLGDFKSDPANIEQGKGYRYVAALWPLILILFSQACSYLTRGKYIFIFFAGALTLINLSGTAQLIDVRNFLKTTKPLPISYESFGFSIANKFGNDINKCSVYGRKVPEKFRNFYFWGLGAELAVYFAESPSNFTQKFQLIPEQYRISFYLSLGHAIAIEAPEDILRITKLISLLDYKYRKYAYAGVGASTFLYRPGLIYNFAKHIQDEYLCSFFEGVGGGVFYSTGYDLTKSNDILAHDLKIEEKFKQCCFQGIGFIFAEESILYPGTLYETLENSVDKVNKEYQVYFLEGLKEKRLLLRETFQ